MSASYAAPPGPGAGGGYNVAGAGAGGYVGPGYNNAGAAGYSNAAAAGYNGAGSGTEWVLEPITWEGRGYLLDRRTGAVYAETAEDQYPEMVGRWQVGAGGGLAWVAWVFRHRGGFSGFRIR